MRITYHSARRTIAWSGFKARYVIVEESITEGKSCGIKKKTDDATSKKENNNNSNCFNNNKNNKYNKAKQKQSNKKTNRLVCTGYQRDLFYKKCVYLLWVEITVKSNNVGFFIS